MKSKGRPLKSFLWRVMLPQLPTTLPQGVSAGDGLEASINVGNSMIAVVSSRVASVASPFYTIESEKALERNRYWYRAKTKDIGTIVLDVYEYEDGLTHEYFDAWRQRIMNSNGTFNNPAVYKKDLRIYRLTDTLKDVMVHTYKGTYISGIADTSSDYEASDLYKYSISFTCDDVETDIISLVDDEIDQFNILKDIIDFERLIENTGDAIENRIRQALPPAVSAYATRTNIGGMFGG